MQIEEQIRGALAAWRTALTQTDGAALLAALGGLDHLCRAHRAELDPQLAHFLERRSYEKAERWLATGESDHGPRSATTHLPHRA